jgi:hypothetical protein
MIAAIRRSQGEDRRPQTPVGQVQEKHYHDNHRRGPWGDGTTERIDQVRSSIARLATPVNGLRSALEEIERRSQALLEKAKGARLIDKAVLFVDKGKDSGEVVKLVERLRDAIAHYQVSEDWFLASSPTYTAGQVSQQQAIYDQITNLTVRVLRLVFILYTDAIGSAIKSSFNTLLRLHEVMEISELVPIFADIRTGTYAVEEQAGFRHGTAALVLTGRRRWNSGWERARATGEAIRVGIRNHP